MNERIIVVASTFPSHPHDSVPGFVRDQVIALKKGYPDLDIHVLAPHDKRSNTKNFTRHEEYTEYRFHYARPSGVEKLTGRGIMPALKANPLNYLLIPMLFIGEFMSLLRLTRKLKPSLIYAHWFTPQGIIARAVGSITKTPFVFTTHAADVDVWHKVPLLGRWMVRSNASKARAFTAVSRRSMAKIQNFFDKEEWTRLSTISEIIPMGVDLPKDEAKPLSQSSSQTVLFVGRLAEKKGVQYLLPAFALAMKTNPNMKLVIAGDGPWLSRLKEIADKLEISQHVSFPGYVTGADKTRLIKSASIYVVPSIITDSGDAEGLPVSLMEGLAYGRICIATNESGADDILSDGKDGFLVTEKDEEELAAALIKSLRLTEDQKINISAAARQTSQQFSWPVIADKHYNFLVKQVIHVAEKNPTHK